MKYRQKSKRRIVNEIAHFRHKYELPLIHANDCIMPENFDEVLEDLIDLDLNSRIYYEVRPTIGASYGQVCEGRCRFH